MPFEVGAPSGDDMIDVAVNLFSERPQSFVIAAGCGADRRAKWEAMIATHYLEGWKMNAIIALRATTICRFVNVDLRWQPLRRGWFLSVRRRYSFIMMVWNWLKRQAFFLEHSSVGSQSGTASFLSHLCQYRSGPYFR